ncbi:MAG TPA: hypothetical protein DC049_03445 [Spirochaetia bacterium]|nr:hypothetical protein [Spirochaetia bacterium]
MYNKLRHFQESYSMQPNILLIIAEELRGDFLHYAGNRDSDTPFLDQLASRGVVFNNHYTVHSKCVPSRSALYNGRYCHNGGHRTLGIPLQAGEINLAEILKNNGYETALALKNHTVSDKISNLCFSSFLTQNEEEPDADAAGFTSNCRKEGDLKADNYLWGRLNIDEKQHTDYKGTQQAIDYINKSREKPFFLNINYKFTHPPYTIMEPYYSCIMKKDISLLPGNPGQDKPEFMKKLHELHRFSELTEHDRKEMLACYYGMIAFIDNRVKELYNALEKSGQLDNTIIIFTSDHGDFAGQYGLPEKWDTIFHDCLLHIPLTIHYPKNFNCRQINAFSENIDLLPTLLDILGLAHPYGIQGKSLLKCLRGETTEHKEYVFAEGGHEKELLELKIEPDNTRKKIVGYLIKARLREIMPDSLRKAKMIRTDKYKLVYRIKDKNEFYNLENDPQEMTNLYYSGKFKQQIAALEKMLLNHLIETEENLPFDPKPIS